MKLEIETKSHMLPRLLKNGGEKAYLQTLRTVQNKSLNAAKRIANEIAQEKYGLPKKGPSMLPPSPYKRPSVKQVLKSRLVGSIGGIQSGVPSKLLGSRKRLSTIRFLESELRPIKQKGLKPKNRKPISIRLGSRVFVSRKRFVQKGRGTNRLHVFRSMKQGKKWKMIRNTVASIYSVLRHEKPQDRMEIAARNKFHETFENELEKRLNKL